MTPLDMLAYVGIVALIVLTILWIVSLVMIIVFSVGTWRELKNWNK
jgi:hypothetical protein